MIYHLIIDIETLATSADAMVLEVGAILYLSNQTTNSYHSFVATPQGNTSTATINFHQEKTDLFHNYFSNLATAKPMSQIVTELNELTEVLGNDIIVWAWGSDFDFPILRTAAEYAGVSFFPSVHYRNFKCLRTFASSFLSDTELPKKPTNAHSALADCQWELEVLKLALAKQAEMVEKCKQQNCSTT